MQLGLQLILTGKEKGKQREKLHNHNKMSQR